MENRLTLLIVIEGNGQGTGRAANGAHIAEVLLGRGDAADVAAHDVGSQRGRHGGRNSLAAS